MKNEVLSNEEKLRLLMKTKEIYVKQYTSCLLYSRHTSLPNYEPIGLCGSFSEACSTFGYEIFPGPKFIKDVIPEWCMEFAYRVSPLGVLSGYDYSYLTYGYWFPIWDKASRVNFLNWLIDKYTEISTMVY